MPPCRSQEGLGGATFREQGGARWRHLGENPRKGTSKDVMGGAGGEATRADLAPVL